MNAGTNHDRAMEWGGTLNAVDAGALTPGVVLDRPLLGGSGQVLLRAGVELTARMCAELVHAGVRVLAPREPAAFFDPQEDPQLEEEERSRRQAARIAWENQRAVRQSRGALRRGAEGVIERRRALWDRLPRRVRPAMYDMRVAPSPNGAGGAGASAMPLMERRERAVVLSRLLSRVLEGGSPSPRPVVEIGEELIDRARRRADDPGACLGVRGFDPGSLEELAWHGLACATICVHAAIRLRWSHRDVLNAALTAMLSDWGMALAPMSVRTAPRPMDDIEFNQVRRHPLWGAAIVDRLMSSAETGLIPPEVALGVFQHHERENARGYPSIESAPSIHDYSKLVAAADVLVGMTGERAHRPALAPALAVQHLVRAADAGELASWAVGAVVDVCGAYPSGSRVRLSSGRPAVVVTRGPGLRADRPIVRLLDAGDGTPGGGVVDLSTDLASGLRVVEAGV